jgi:Cell division protein CrgA
VENVVPKSSVRKKKVYTPPAELRSTPTAATKRPSPTWLPITAVVLIVLGIAWLVVFYLSQGLYPVFAWGYWNLAVGFGAMVIALGILSKWR